MKEIIIVGAGGHGAEIDEYIRYSQEQTGKEEIRIAGFLDDDPDNYHAYQLSAPLLGGIREHRVPAGQLYIMGIANLQYRKEFMDMITGAGGTFVSFIHCTAYISPSASIGEGTVIGPHVNLGPNVKVGSYNLINSRSSLGHDTQIGDGNFISPNVCFSGFTRVGHENMFGINVSTIPGIAVGDRNKIAAGMVLNQDVADDSVVFYRYKEKVIAKPRGM